MTSAVTVQDIEMTFGQHGETPTTALQDMTIDVAVGEFIAVVGPSGCGKTTLLRIIAGLTRPTGGTVSVNGQTVESPHPDASMMFQSPTLLPWRKVIDNCLLPIELRRRVQDKDQALAMDLLARTGLDGFEHRYPHELSGGMQQRVSLCRALIAEPSLLLLDEPFGALDAMTRDQMNLDLHQMWLQQSVTTVLITHSINEAVFLAQRVVVMSPRPGRVLEIVDIPLPDRRNPDAMTTEQFARTCAHIRSYFTRSDTVAQQ